MANQLIGSLSWLLTHKSDELLAGYERYERRPLSVSIVLPKCSHKP